MSIFNLKYFKYSNLEFFFALPKSLYFNLKYFKIADAIKFPIFVSNHVYLKELGGRITIEAPLKPAMIQIGFRNVGIFDEKYSRSIWQVRGSILFKGTAFIGHGSKIIVSETGLLLIGNNFQITAESSIICYKLIEFGHNVLISWENLIMDTDFHKILSDDGQILNENQPILIGNHVWIGYRCTILKGTIIEDNNIIASNSLLNKHIIGNGKIIGGSPARILQSEIRWEV